MSGPTIPINGRVDPKQICRVALYMRELGYKPVNRSEVVRFTFDMAEAFLDRVQPTEFDIENNHEALSYLSSLGLKWPGKDSKKSIMRALQYDTLQDMTPEQIAEVQAFAESLKGKDRPDFSAMIEPDEDDIDLLKELEEVSKSKRGKNDGN